MRLRDLVTFAFLVLLLFSSAKATPFTFRSTGTIRSLQDDFGIFGAGGTNIAGQKFVLTATTDTSNVVSEKVDKNYIYLHGLSTVWFSLTLNKSTYSGVVNFDPARDNGSNAVNEAGIYNWVSANGATRQWPDEVYLMAFGLDNYGRTTTVTQLLYSYYNSFVGSSPDFNAKFSYIPNGQDSVISSLWISQDEFFSGFSGRVDLVEINPSDTLLPEPSVLLTFGFGFALLYAVRRRMAFPHRHGHFR